MGTGTVDDPMWCTLMADGYQAVVPTRTKAKAGTLLQRGAKWADSPRELAGMCDVVFGIVGFPSDVEEVFLGANGALAGARPGTILVDMTTSKPSLAVQIPVLYTHLTLPTIFHVSTYAVSLDQKTTN